MNKRIMQLLLATLLPVLHSLALYAGNEGKHLLTLSYDNTMGEVSVEGFKRTYQNGDSISDGAYVMLLVKPFEGHVMEGATLNGEDIHFERYEFDKEGKTLAAYFTVREDIDIEITFRAIRYAKLSLKYDATKGLADVNLADQHFKDGDPIPMDTELVLDLIPNEESEVESVLINGKTYLPEDFKQSVLTPGSMYRLIYVTEDLNIEVHFKGKGTAAALIQSNADQLGALVSLYGAAGQKLYEGPVDGVSLSNLPGGIYFIVRQGSVQKLIL